MKSPKRDWGEEKLFTMTELVKENLPIERESRTWSKWASKGFLHRGRWHLLPTVLIAGIRHTSIEAVREFITACGEPARISENHPRNQIKERK